MKAERMTTRIVVTVEFDVRTGESPAQRADAVMAAIGLKLGDVVNRRTAEVKKLHRGAIWPAATGIAPRPEERPHDHLHGHIKTRAGLAVHIGTPHPNGQNITPSSELKRWTMDELVRAHEDLHAPAKAEVA